MMNSRFRIILTKPSINACLWVPKYCRRNTATEAIENLQKSHFLRDSLIRSVLAVKKKLTVEDWGLLRSFCNVPSLTFGGNAMLDVSRLNASLETGRSLLKLMEHENSINIFMKTVFVGLLGCNPDECTAEDKEFIESVFNENLTRFPVLHPVMACAVIRGLAVLPHWKESVHKVLAKVEVNDHKAPTVYNTAAEVAFLCGDFDAGMRMFDQLMKSGVSPRFMALEAAVDHIYKVENDTQAVSLLFQLLDYFDRSGACPDFTTARRIIEFLEHRSKSWVARFTTIDDHGTCSCCNNKLELKEVSLDDYETLKKCVLDYVASKEFFVANTTSKDMKMFQQFLETCEPYTIVVDGLNVTHARGAEVYRLLHLLKVLQENGEKVLLLGRVHMLKWPGIKSLQTQRSVQHFFVKNSSNDDTVILFATIMGGSSTLFLTNDMLGGHNKMFSTYQLKSVFRKWQYQHQVHFDTQKNAVLFPAYSADYQSTGNVIHLPFCHDQPHWIINSVHSDPHTWLCLQNVGEERKAKAEDIWPTHAATPPWALQQTSMRDYVESVMSGAERKLKITILNHENRAKIIQGSEFHSENSDKGNSRPLEKWYKSRENVSGTFYTERYKPLKKWSKGKENIGGKYVDELSRPWKKRSQYSGDFGDKYYEESSKSLNNFSKGTKNVDGNFLSESSRKKWSKDTKNFGYANESSGQVKKFSKDSKNVSDTSDRRSSRPIKKLTKDNS